MLAFKPLLEPKPLFLKPRPRSFRSIESSTPPWIPLVHILSYIYQMANTMKCAFTGCMFPSKTKSNTAFPRFWLGGAWRPSNFQGRHKRTIDGMRDGMSDGMILVIQRLAVLSSCGRAPAGARSIAVGRATSTGPGDWGGSWWETDGALLWVAFAVKIYWFLHVPAKNTEVARVFWCWDVLPVLCGFGIGGQWNPGSRAACTKTFWIQSSFNIDRFEAATVSSCSDFVQVEAILWRFDGAGSLKATM